jgi:hypothetical protein
MRNKVFGAMLIVCVIGMATLFGSSLYIDRQNEKADLSTAAAGVSTLGISTPALITINLRKYRVHLLAYKLRRIVYSKPPRTNQVIVWGYWVSNMVVTKTTTSMPAEPVANGEENGIRELLATKGITGKP